MPHLGYNIKSSIRMRVSVNKPYDIWKEYNCYKDSFLYNYILYVIQKILLYSYLVA